MLWPHGLESWPSFGAFEEILRQVPPLLSLLFEASTHPLKTESHREAEASACSVLTSSPFAAPSKAFPTRKIYSID
jgi:hypothetical protein